jgi:hypothetical protein
MANDEHPNDLDDLANRLDRLEFGDYLSLPARNFRRIFEKNGIIGTGEINAASELARRHACGFDYGTAEYESGMPAVFTKRKL